MNSDGENAFKVGEPQWQWSVFFRLMQCVLYGQDFAKAGDWIQILKYLFMKGLHFWRWGNWRNLSTSQTGIWRQSPKLQGELCNFFGKK